MMALLLRQSLLVGSRSFRWIGLSVGLTEKYEGGTAYLTDCTYQVGMDTENPHTIRSDALTLTLRTTGAGPPVPLSLQAATRMPKIKM